MNTPEKKIQTEIVKFLECRGWYVVRIIGNALQHGLPDLYATHKDYGGRWIEVKLPDMKGSRFTPAQLDVMPKLNDNGSPVYIMTGATHAEYKKLFSKETNLSSHIMRKLLR
jgi:hypothetical protein